MCLIVFAYDINTKYHLIVGANRDEFVDRPTAPMAFWTDYPTVLAGRDLKSGGTWMGITRSGRFGAVTNIRRPGAFRADAASRGALVSDFLTGQAPVADYIAHVAKSADRYNGFNLLVADTAGIAYLNSEAPEPTLLSPGIYGLSNDRLDTPWPKVDRARQRLAQQVSDAAVSSDALFTILADRHQPPDGALPDTGVGLARERMLSPICITGRDYGTRSSTALTWRVDGNVRVEEHTIINPLHPHRQKRRSFSFQIATR